MLHENQKEKEKKENKEEKDGYNLKQVDQGRLTQKVTA